MNILILAHFYPPEMGGAAARLSGMAKWLQRYGNQVTVITGIPNYPQGSIYPGYKNKFLQYSQSDGVTVIRTRSFCSTRKSALLRILNYLNFMFLSIIAGIKNHGNYDIVLASSPPLFIGISGWVLAKIYHIPLIFDIRDLWPDIAVETGEFSAKSLIVRLGRIVADFIHRNSDRLTPVTESKQEKLIGQGISEDKISVIHNGIDLDFISADQQVTAIDELRQNGKIVFIYAGLIGIAQGLEIVINSAFKLQHNQNLHFVIIGDGFHKKHLMQLAESYNLTNITFLPSQSRKSIPSFLKQSDVALIPLANSNISDAIPSKLMEAWGCQLPVILIADGEAKKLVEDANGGVTLLPGQADQLVDVIKELSSNKQKRMELGRKGYDYIINSYTREALTKRMDNLLQQFNRQA